MPYFHRCYLNPIQYMYNRQCFSLRCNIPPQMVSCIFTKPCPLSKEQSNLSSFRPREEKDVDWGFSCYPRIYLILFSASSIGKVSGSRLLHSGQDKLVKIKNVQQHNLPSEQTTTTYISASNPFNSFFTLTLILPLNLGKLLREWKIQLIFSL